MRILHARATFSLEENFVQKNVRMLGRLLRENVRAIIEIVRRIQLIRKQGRRLANGTGSRMLFTTIRRDFMSPNPTIMIFIMSVMALFIGCGSSNREKPISYSQFTHHSEDSLITTNLKARVLREPELEGRMIRIETTDGTVHLSGFANNSFQTQRAEDLAREIPGVISVKNNLRGKSKG